MLILIYSEEAGILWANPFASEENMLSSAVGGNAVKLLINLTNYNIKNIAENFVKS